MFPEYITKRGSWVPSFLTDVMIFVYQFFNWPYLSHTILVVLTYEVCIYYSSFNFLRVRSNKQDFCTGNYCSQIHYEFRCINYSKGNMVIVYIYSRITEFHVSIASIYNFDEIWEHCLLLTFILHIGFRNKHIVLSTMHRSEIIVYFKNRRLLYKRSSIHALYRWKQTTKIHIKRYFAFIKTI